MPAEPTIAETFVTACAAHGVKRLFGVPGGGSSLDLIAAARAQDVGFVLTQTETAAVLMAAVTAELTGAPGVALTGIGPGAASALNGVAYAALERAPLLLVTDCAGPDPAVFSAHQRFDQGAVFSPLVKETARLDETAGTADIDRLLALAAAPPQGPVHVDLSAAVAAMPAVPPAANEALGRRENPEPLDEAALTAGREILKHAKRPVIAAGLYARTAPAAAGLRALAADLRCPVLLTYKAKGVLPDDDPRMVGLLTGARVEAPCLERADLILFYGLDPVELIPSRWAYRAPIVDLSPTPGALPVPPAAQVSGPLADLAGALIGRGQASAWQDEEIAALKADMSGRLTMPPAQGRSAQAVVETAALAAPPGTRATVDSGAHMVSAMAFWPATAPLDVLKSNGLSTMAYALPAAIAAALADPARGVIAFTGDAGLMMCLGELATAARLGCRIAVIVFNDAALSLIEVKQRRQGRATTDIQYPAVDFAAIAEGLGCRAWRADPNDDLPSILTQAFDHTFAAGAGPAVIDVAVDPSGYPAQLQALRG